MNILWSSTTYVRPFIHRHVYVHAELQVSGTGRPRDLKLSQFVVFDQGKGKNKHGWVVIHFDSHYNPLRCVPFVVHRCLMGPKDIGLAVYFVPYAIEG